MMLLLLPVSRTGRERMSVSQFRVCIIHNRCIWSFLLYRRVGWRVSDSEHDVELDWTCHVARSFLLFFASRFCFGRLSFSLLRSPRAERVSKQEVT